MRKLVAVLAVALLLTAFGCGSSSTGPSGNDDYLPLAVGNQWSYSLNGYITFTDADTALVTGSNFNIITGTTTHQQGFELYAMRDSLITIITTPDTTFTTTKVTMNYIQETDTELRLYDDTTTTDYEIFIKLPVTLNDSWTPETDDPTITRTVLSLSASAIVPAGTYSSCANLRDTDSEEPNFYFDWFFARGTGVVKYVTNYSDSEGTVFMTYDLLSSTIN
ncbi:MAG: hypothetical protein K8S62_06300 [Candidatus Sabulitectum sp.]|nr:hypothetical protein [Candidatus Sabulitectum sp.]